MTHGIKVQEVGGNRMRFKVGKPALEPGQISQQVVVPIRAIPPATLIEQFSGPVFTPEGQAPVFGEFLGSGETVFLGGLAALLAAYIGRAVTSGRFPGDR